MCGKAGQACWGIGGTYKSSHPLAAPPACLPMSPKPSWPAFSRQAGSTGCNRCGVTAVQVQPPSPWASDKEKKCVVINLPPALNGLGLQAYRLNFSPIFHRSHAVACQGAASEQSSDGVLDVWQGTN